VLDQHAGHYQMYDNNFAVITVTKAGHMVPVTQPKAAYQLFYNFINNKGVNNQIFWIMILFICQNNNFKYNNEKRQIKQAIFYKWLIISKKDTRFSQIKEAKKTIISKWWF
jgi:Serine carboxypeptidase